MTGYTGFSSDASEQSGHYLVLHCTSESGAVITAQLIGGAHGAVTLDDDGIVIIRVTATTQSVRIIATKEGSSVTKNFALTDMTLAPEG